MNSKEFSLKIEGLVKKRNVHIWTYYIIVVKMTLASDNKSCVSKSLKEKIKIETTDLRLLKEN